MAKNYDILVTNPPYMGSGNMNNSSYPTYLKKHYPDSKSDLFSAFMEYRYLCYKTEWIICEL